MQSNGFATSDHFGEDDGMDDPTMRDRFERYASSTHDDDACPHGKRCPLRRALLDAFMAGAASMYIAIRDGNDVEIIRQEIQNYRRSAAKPNVVH